MLEALEFRHCLHDRLEPGSGRRPDAVEPDASVILTGDDAESLAKPQGPGWMAGYAVATTYPGVNSRALQTAEGPGEVVASPGPPRPKLFRGLHPCLGRTR